MENKKSDSTVRVALITVIGGVLTTIISVIAAPLILREINKTPTPTMALVEIIQPTNTIAPTFTETAEPTATVTEVAIILNTDTPIPLPQPQQVRWGPVDGLDAGICLNVCENFVNWADLKSEIELKVFPQVGQIPVGSIARVNDSGGKSNWIVEVVDPGGYVLGNIWFGPNPLNGWAYDGLIRIGVPTSPLIVWATFERFSDGSYRLR